MSDLRAVLAARARKFEWEVAHGDEARAMARKLRGFSHDLLNFVQVADLTSQALATVQLPPPFPEFIADLARSAGEAKAKIKQLSAVTHGALDRPVIRTPVEATLRAVVDELRGVGVGAELRVSEDAHVAWTADELANSVVTLALDARDSDRRVQISTATTDADRELLVIRCAPLAADRFAIVVVTAVAARAGGKIEHAGDQLTVAIPIVA